MARSLESYERAREGTKRRSREKLELASDIGDIPAVVNPARRAACERDLERFLTTYFPQSTGLSPFSDDHKRVVGRIQQCILDGGLFINAVYRGFAKTTISENAAIWAVLFGHRRFVPIFGADASAADGNIDSIKLELSENDLLYEDFPEVCHAIRALEGKPQRCASQTHDGRQTHIEWRADTIVLPTIEGSIASGAILTAHGIMGASRGMKHKTPGGTQQRPDFVIIDDPQTDESAATALQVTKRLDTIRKSILKLGGHNRRIACVVNATVIRPDDLVETLLDPKKFPAWQGERIKMVRAWSKVNDTLWMNDYARLRNTFDPNLLGDQQRAHREATEFYRRNRRKMDEGCAVSWQHCYDRELELSAIQHAYNLLIDDGPDVFASECQNEPTRKDTEEAEAITASKIAEKLNGCERGTVPAEATQVVAFIDVHKSLLYWTAMAFGDGFSGAVVDYGTWPDQKATYFSAAKARRTILSVTKASGLEESIYAALDRLVGDLMAREWVRADGTSLRIERIGIDANWGDSTDVIYQFCRQSPHSAVLLPWHGKYVGATSRPFNEYQKKPGEKFGEGWRLTNSGGRRAIRYVLADVNRWKTFVRSRLTTDMGGRGCMTLFGTRSEAHRLFADHLVSENGISVEAKGRTVVEWKWKPSRPDNHYLDTVVGCHVMAAIQGATLIERTHGERKRVKLSDLQRRKRQAA